MSSLTGMNTEAREFWRWAEGNWRDEKIDWPIS